MNDRENRRYQMFGRVQTFGQNNASDFAPASKALAYFSALGKVIKDIDAAKILQPGGDITAREVLVDSLRLDLQNIGRTARAFEQDQPGFAAKFRLPDGAGPGPLLTAANAFVTELKKPGIAAQFIEHEQPADFVKNLEDDRQAIEAAQDSVEGDDSDGVESTAAIGRLIREGMRLVTYLNAIMHNKYARVPEKLRAWESASHVERAPQREKKSANVTSVTTPQPKPPLAA